MSFFDIQEWLPKLIQGGPVFIQGLKQTFTLFFQAGSLGFVLGCVVALGKARYLPGFYWVSWFYIELFRNIPLLIILFFFYYGLQFQADVAGLFALLAWASAFTAEVLRAGIESLDHQQIQSAQLLGFNRYQLIVNIVMPQALMRVLPILANQFMNLAKNTSIVYFVGVLDVTYAFEQLAAEHFLFFHFFGVALSIYVILSLSIIYFFRFLELLSKAYMQPKLPISDYQAEGLAMMEDHG